MSRNCCQNPNHKSYLQMVLQVPKPLNFYVNFQLQFHCSCRGKASTQHLSEAEQIEVTAFCAEAENLPDSLAEYSSMSKLILIEDTTNGFILRFIHCSNSPSKEKPVIVAATCSAQHNTGCVLLSSSCLLKACHCDFNSGSDGQNPSQPAPNCFNS